MVLRYELATLSVGLGAAGEVVPAIARYVSGPAAAGKLLGCWTSDIGVLNQIAILREFACEADLARERERTLLDANPFGAGAHLRRLALESYAPFPDLPPVAIGAFGPVYEIRSYVLKPGGVLPTFAGWKECLAGRTRLSRLVVAMYALDGVPRITHIWPYASTDARGAIRADAVKEGVWPPKSANWLTGEMQSEIYLPTAISPLQ